MKNQRFVELLHDLTQNYTAVYFSSKLKGTVEVRFSNFLCSKCNYNNKLGVPYGSNKELEKEILNSLANCLKLHSKHKGSSK